MIEKIFYHIFHHLFDSNISNDHKSFTFWMKDLWTSTKKTDAHFRKCVPNWKKIKYKIIFIQIAIVPKITSLWRQKFRLHFSYWLSRRLSHNKKDFHLTCWIFRSDVFIASLYFSLSENGVLFHSVKALSFSGPLLRHWFEYI